MVYIEYCKGDICKSFVIEFALYMQEYAKSCGMDCIPFSREIAQIGLADAYSRTTIGVAMSSLQKEGILILVQKPIEVKKKGDATKWYKVVAPSANEHYDTCSYIDTILDKWQNIPTNFLQGLCDATCKFIDRSVMQPSKPIITTKTESLVDKINLGIDSFSDEEKLALLKMLGKSETLHTLKETQPILYQAFASRTSNVIATPDLKELLLSSFNPGSYEYNEVKRLFFLAKGINLDKADYEELLSRFKLVASLSIEGREYKSLLDLSRHLCNWERKGNPIKNKQTERARVKTVENVAY